jgi:hypothetical protein
MAWQKKGFKGNEDCIRFEAGKVIEGILKNARLIPSPWKEGERVVEIRIEVEGKEKTLTSSSRNLKEAFKDLVEGTHVKIEMVMKGGKKLYNVYANE